MRLRYVYILSTICICLTFAFLHKTIASTTYNTCDILVINDTYKSIEKDLQTIHLSEVESKYSCNIIMREDRDYNNRLSAAISKGNVIIDYLEDDILRGKIIFPTNSDTFSLLKRNMIIALWCVFAFIIILLYSIFFALYVRILKPFRQLKRFADNISVGNLDLPLTMDRGNYFGAFTESFDMMREELKNAKQGEYEANKAKKELVAELSHDIKTPVSTIKALCEILDIKLKDEDSITKIHTINQKADIIDKLINNMFHATLEELEVLKIEPIEELSTILTTMFTDLNHYGKIRFKNQLTECLIYCDKLRLNQVIDNVINNSYKYADTDIEVTYKEEPNVITIEIRDYGNSMMEGDFPLVFEKFYRGSNATSHSGSGLGLYLAKKFMVGMKGDIECFYDHGFVVLLTIKKV